MFFDSFPQPPPFIDLPLFARVSVYTFALAVSIGLSMLFALWRTPVHEQSGALTLCMVALLGGVIGGRAEHVLLQWTYFADHISEIVDLRAGGYDWHGALLGALLFAWLTWRWLRYPFAFGAWLRRITIALPLITFAAWYGCWAAGCAFGVEVDTLANFSPIIVSELRDVYGIVAPRWHTAFMGMALALFIAVGLLARVRRAGWRGVLLCLCVSMFLIGFFRGDAVPVLGSYRLDQWLDALIACGCLASVLATRRVVRKAYA
jgi:prolipoprotein diacylglyceryltransferase